jgi:hypothetical protein
MSDFRLVYIRFSKLVKYEATTGLNLDDFTFLKEITQVRLVRCMETCKDENRHCNAFSYTDGSVCRHFSFPPDKELSCGRTKIFLMDPGKLNTKVDCSGKRLMVC